MYIKLNRIKVDRNNFITTGPLKLVPNSKPIAPNKQMLLKHNMNTDGEINRWSIIKDFFSTNKTPNTCK